MALLTWPGLLPLPQRAGNSRTVTDPAARSAIMNGPLLALSRTSRTREGCPLSLVLTDDELAYFDAWWHVILGQGCAWVRMALAGEGGVATVTGRLSGGYHAAHVSGYWQVSLQVELDAPELG